MKCRKRYNGALDGAHCATHIAQRCASIMQLAQNGPLHKHGTLRTVCVLHITRDNPV